MLTLFVSQRFENSHVRELGKNPRKYVGNVVRDGLGTAWDISKRAQNYRLIVVVAALVCDIKITFEMLQMTQVRLALYFSSRRT
jgi:hypothetical protein